MRLRTIQNILFVTVAGLSVSMPACVMCVAPGGGESIGFSDSLAFVVLSLAAFILAVLAVCNTSRAQVKLRLAVPSAVVLLGYQIWIAVVFFQLKDAYVFRLPAVFPLVALILDMLALRYVVKELSMSAALEIKSTMDMAKKHVNNKKTNVK